GSVSRVLNGNSAVSESTREAVMNAIKVLNYTPNSMAKRLREQRSGVIALMVPIVYHPFFAQFIDCVTKQIDKYGYSVLLVASQQNVEKENEIIQKIKKKEVDGAIFVTHYLHAEEEIRGLPLVSIDRRLSPEIPCVTSNNYDATMFALEYLKSKGCKKIGFLGTKPFVESEVSLRKQAYDDFIKENQMQGYSVFEAAEHGNEQRLCEEFLQKFDEVDGLFASGYSIAMAFERLAKSKGYKIPEDVQLIAYDGTFRNFSADSLISCIEQPIEEMAKQATKLLLEKIKGKSVPEKVVLQSKFVVGTTTK
ncbi:MAG: LacI family DNA-binding transcriptional regulator, partial [Clostridia bacterium]|nr:LacI family DNA-binding transcriptional regulator [Clostridia bacterium]